MEPVLIKIVPIEYQKTTKYKDRRHYPRIIIFTDIKLNPNLTQEKFDEILSKVPLKKKARGIANPKHYIFYNYGNEPMVILDLVTGEVFTTKTIIEYYGITKPQIQASIILKILKRFNQASFKRKVLSTYRLGTDKEAIEQIFNAYIRLIGERNE